MFTYQTPTRHALLAHEKRHYSLWVTEQCQDCCFRGRMSAISTSKPRSKTSEHVRGEQLLPGDRGPSHRARGRPVGYVDVRPRPPGTLLYRQPPRGPGQQVLRLRLAASVQRQRARPVQSPRPEHRLHLPTRLARTMVAGMCDILHVVSIL